MVSYSLNTVFWLVNCLTSSYRVWSQHWDCPDHNCIHSWWSDHLSSLSFLTSYKKISLKARKYFYKLTRKIFFLWTKFENISFGQTRNYVTWQHPCIIVNISHGVGEVEVLRSDEGDSSLDAATPPLHHPLQLYLKHFSILQSSVTWTNHRLVLSQPIRDEYYSSLLHHWTLRERWVCWQSLL